MNYQVSTHSYLPDTNRYEQSLDVYQPTTTTTRTTRSCERSHANNKNNNNNKPVIVLVMGSGWMGHVAWIYNMTGWWNARGPKSICSRLGYTCISIRHSGGFFRSTPLLIQSIGLSILFPKYLLCWMILWLILVLQGQNAATTIEEMTNDVSAAFQFIEQNSTTLGIAQDSKLIIGGYSSGGHLLGTYANNTIENPQHKLSDRVIGILYLSGVLSLKNCWAMNAITMTVFGCNTWEMPPSPIETITPEISKMPHLVVGCDKELFGLPLLDNAFCAKEYYNTLKQNGNANSEYVLLPSNHWFVLSSQALTDALEEHIPKVFLYDTKKQDLLSSSSTSTSRTLPSLSSFSLSSSSSSSDVDMAPVVSSTHVTRRRRNTPELRRQHEVLSSFTSTSSTTANSTT